MAAVRELIRALALALTRATRTARPRHYVRSLWRSRNGSERARRRRQVAFRRLHEARLLGLKQSRCRQCRGFALPPGANHIGPPVDWVESPARPDNFYGTRVCAVDADGNEVAGVRLPPIAVPLGTYTGWNVYRAQPCELCDRDGSLIPFARTRMERTAAGDPRPSLEERYANCENYVGRVEGAAAALVADRLLLRADAAAYINAARECDRF